jgi:hypothetical protein
MASNDAIFEDLVALHEQLDEYQPSKKVYTKELIPRPAFIEL